MIFSAEWTYLLTTRKVGGEDSAFSFVRLKYGSNATDTVSGVIIYPDDFSFSEAGVANIAFGAIPLTQQINAADWEALENAGCIFLPGNREYAFTSSASQAITIDEKSMGLYFGCWGSSANSASTGFQIYFMLNGRSTTSYTNRFYGFNVRLAQDL